MNYYKLYTFRNFIIKLFVRTDVLKNGYLLNSDWFAEDFHMFYNISRKLDVNKLYYYNFFRWKERLKYKQRKVLNLEEKNTRRLDLNRVL